MLIKPVVFSVCPFRSSVLSFCPFRSSVCVNVLSLTSITYTESGAFVFSRTMRPLLAHRTHTFTGNIHLTRIPTCAQRTSILIYKKVTIISYCTVRFESTVRWLAQFNH